LAGFAEMGRTAPRSGVLKAVELREFYHLPPMLALLLFADLNGRAKVMVKAA